MPPVAYEPPKSQTGPTTLGAQQAEHLARLRRLRQQERAQSLGKKRKPGGGISASELVTDFDAAMDEAYDQLTGRNRRKPSQDESEESQEDAATQFRVGATRWRA